MNTQPGGQPHPVSAAAAEAMDRLWIRNLLDASDEVIYFKDLQSRFLRVSLGMANRHGLTQAQLSGKTDSDLFAEAHAASALADEREILRTGLPIVNKEECEGFADGAVRWVSTSKFPLHDIDGRIVGTTSYLNIRREHRGCEIGSTFYEPQARGGPVNPECKRLMLANAFDQGALRVDIVTDARNLRSQAAIAKLGAVREAVLRRHKITWTGHIRDTVVFAVTDLDWPQVRDRLDRRLAAAG